VNSPPKELISQMEKEGHKNIAICGGASIYSQFLQSGVVDKLFLVVEPYIFGSGIKLFDKKLDARLKLVEISKLSERTILLEYDIIT
jgi:dihydrofolate reductase